MLRKTLAAAALSGFFLFLAGCGGGSGGSSVVSGPPPVALVLTLSATSFSFGSVTVGQTSTAQTLTITDTGSSAITLSGEAITGATTDFTNTTTCGTSLAPNASCSFTIAFTPQTAGALNATITVTDNASNSPQSITLTGVGTAAVAPPALTRTLYVFPAAFPETANPDASVSALYALINSAKQTVDMTMYELEDSTFTGDLVADCARGVIVRVIMDQGELNSSGNMSSFDTLNSSGPNCSAVASNAAFENTHQKTITVDDATTAIMSLNLQTQYYTTTRDFALVENDPADIAAIEATFNADYAAGTPYNGAQRASDFSYVPGGGDTTVFPAGDLIWSPTTAQADMLSLINNATRTIVLENEEMGASNIVSALEAACQRGVTVHIAMTNDDNEYGSEFTALQAAGCGVNVYPDTQTGFYVHAKALVADYGLPTQNAYMGSINYSNASMTENRELGLYISTQSIVDTIESTITADYAGGTPY